MPYKPSSNPFDASGFEENTYSMLMWLSHSKLMVKVSTLVSQIDSQHNFILQENFWNSVNLK
jgi:hypothetical protein